MANTKPVTFVHVNENRCIMLTARERVQYLLNSYHAEPSTKKRHEVAIARQPGATALWITNKYETWKVDNGLLFKLGDPLEVLWFCQGREATRAEVMQSIESGYPILLEMAQKEGEFAVKSLESKKQEALALLPKN